jgi:citrate lyase subunit beta-like protein
LSASAHPCLQALDDVSFGRSERAIRINSIQSGLAADDLRAVLTGRTLPDAVVVPKVGDARWLAAVDGYTMIIDLRLCQHTQ